MARMASGDVKFKGSEATRILQNLKFIHDLNHHWMSLVYVNWSISLLQDCLVWNEFGCHFNSQEQCLLEAYDGKTNNHMSGVPKVMFLRPWLSILYSTI